MITAENKNRYCRIERKKYLRRAFRKYTKLMNTDIRYSQYGRIVSDEFRGEDKVLFYMFRHYYHSLGYKVEYKRSGDISNWWIEISWSE